MTNIFVIGYYEHDNVGDEQYKKSFNYIFETYLPKTESFYIQYIDCDIIKSKKFLESDIIIIGGGDILNHYFLDEINRKFSGKKNKIIAVSVGMPYNEILVNTNKLGIIDYIFIRTQQDFELFSQYYRADRIYYLPDISYYLLNIEVENTDIYDFIFKKLDLVQKNKQKIIAFCLNRHIYTKSTKGSYDDIVSEFAKTIKLLIEQGFFIVLVPFNSSGDSDDAYDNMENDIIIQNEVYNLLNENKKKNILNIDVGLTVNQTFKLFDYFYITVPMRFHACLFSIYKEIPMIPVFTTKKIQNFLLDIKWKKFYHLETDANDLPLTLDSQLLFSKINQLFIDQRDPNSNRNPNGNRNTLTKSIKQLFLCSEVYDNSNEYINNKNILNLANNVFKSQLAYEIHTVIDVITVPFIKEFTMGFSNNTDIVIENLSAKLKDYTQIAFEKINDINQKNDIVAIVSYYLTNGFDSIYNHGLLEKMFLKDYNKYEEWKWIIKDLHMNKNSLMKVNSYETGIFNMDYIDQNDYSDSHRSGWQYIINNVKTLNNKKSNLYLDLSVDKTFHWKENVNKIVGILPYTQDWVGFIHHTFDSTFSEYNNTELLKKQTFLDSLKFCKGLLVFSYALKDNLINELSMLDSKYIVPPIFVLCHPTEIVMERKSFSWKKFVSNNDKKLIHIGGWLRNIFSFYALSIPTNYDFSISGRRHQTLQKTIAGKIRKVALKGRNMDNYFPESETIITTKNNKSQQSNCSQNNDSSVDKNNWNKHLIEYTKDMCDSVEVIERVSNEEYDELLTQNIIFINLVDASAVNTILECIIRNTPIIVNKIPAVIELLGEDYPLYFDNSIGHINEQISFIMFDTRNLKAAHKYLKAMDKTKFTIECFINNLSEIINAL